MRVRLKGKLISNLGNLTSNMRFPPLYTRATKTAAHQLPFTQVGSLPYHPYCGRYDYSCSYSHDYDCGYGYRYDYGC
jgi:hypothetical protein